jgi:hypothetical protein
MKAGILAAAAALLLPLGADAQSYRCITKDGKKLYGSTIPPQCVGQPVEQLNKHGTVVKRIDPEAEERERRAKQAAEAKKLEEKAAKQQTQRRNNALLATYASPKDIDDARTRALANNQKMASAIQTRIEQIQQLQAGYEKELAAHKGNPPAKLAQDAQAAGTELKRQQELLAARQKEVEQINARYDEDKRRYFELTGRR